MPKDVVLHENKTFPAQLRQAAFAPDSFNPETRTVRLEYVGPGLVKRYSWAENVVFWEELGTEKGMVRLDRLNNGAPLLNDHQRWNGLSDQIGVCEGADETHCVVRLSPRESVKEIVQDVAAGIYRNVSVGYVVHQYEQIGFNESDGLPVWRAIDWEPLEVSLVTIPADPNTGVRQMKNSVQSSCTVIQRNVQDNPTQNEEKPAMTTKNTPAENPDGGLERKDTPTAPAATSAADLADAVKRGQEEERARVHNIHEAVRKAGLDQVFEKKMISDGKTIDEVRALIIDELHEKQKAPTARPHARAAGGHDEVDLRNEAIANAIEHRADPKTALSDQGRQYRGLSLIEVARDLMGSEGRGLSKMEIAKRSLHSTSDFANILANVANKRLRKAYDGTVPSYTRWATASTNADFKEKAVTALSSLSDLERVPEGGEYKHGTFGEGAEKYALSTYGKIIGITRQAIVNDDMSAFTRLPTMYANTARRLQNKLVYAQLGANPNMADGIALFHASHNNLITDVLGVTGLGVARAKMRTQKDPGGNDALNIIGKYLVLPSGLETIGEQLATDIMAQQVTNVNPFARSYEIIVEPMLDAYSVDDWYVIADPNQIDTVEYATLEGEDGPYMEMRDGYEVDGVEFKCRIDFAAKAVDFRGMVKSTSGT